jgi:hypothetical protein
MCAFSEKRALTEYSPLSLLLFGTKSWRVLKILSQRTKKSLLRICTLQPPSLYPGSFIQLVGFMQLF